MSFSRGVALAAMAAAGTFSALGNTFEREFDLIRDEFGPSPEALFRRMSGRYGRSHWRGNKGQFEKAVARRRRRNEMRRETHRLQRTAG